MREVREETGLSVENMRLEAVLLDIEPVAGEPYNWLIYHFSANLKPGEVRSTDEGELIWLTQEEILRQELHPSVRPIIEQILDCSVGTLFVTNTYVPDRHSIERSLIEICEARH